MLSKNDQVPQKKTKISSPDNSEKDTSSFTELEECFLKSCDNTSKIPSLSDIQPKPAAPSPSKSKQPNKSPKKPPKLISKVPLVSVTMLIKPIISEMAKSIVELHNQHKHIGTNTHELDSIIIISTELQKQLKSQLPDDNESQMAVELIKKVLQELE